MENQQKKKETTMLVVNITLTALSLLMILVPAVIGLTLEKSFAEHCICVINILSYAWIAFAISIVSNLKHILLRQVRFKVFFRYSDFFNTFFLLLSTVSFLTGMVLFIVFTCRYLNVI